MRKGQLTLEFLIILVVMFLLFSAISSDLIDYSLTNTLEIQTAETVRSTEILLDSSINSLLYQGPGARKTVYIRAPPDCDYLVNSSQVKLECEEGSASYENYNGMIIGEAPEGISYSCQNCVVGRIESGVVGEIRVIKFT